LRIEAVTEVSPLKSRISNLKFQIRNPKSEIRLWVI
jgi:hypothetical protein